MRSRVDSILPPSVAFTESSSDGTFGGGDGMVTQDFFGFGDNAYGVDVQPDGKIVVTGVQHEQQHDETMLATHQLRAGAPVLHAEEPPPASQVEPAPPLLEHVVIGDREEMVALLLVPVGDHVRELVPVAPEGVRVQVPLPPPRLRLLRGHRPRQQRQEQQRRKGAVKP